MSVSKPQQLEQDPHKALERLIRRIGAVPELPMQRQLMQEHIERTDPPELAFQLDQLIRRCVTGQAEAFEPLLGVVLWMLQHHVSDAEGETYDVVRDLYNAAAEAERSCVTMFLLELPPHKVAKHVRQNTAQQLNKDLSLGERKQMARGHNRRILEALSYDGDPQVIRKLCKNPGMREQDILSIVTRRPNQPAVLREIATTPRWLARYSIRHALVLNPYNETGLSVKLLPFLKGRDLRSISLSGDLHPLIPESAKTLLKLRELHLLKP